MFQTSCIHLHISWITWNRGVRYHEPEYWKFGENGNKYFRHATGQLYAISKDLASFISLNRSCFNSRPTLRVRNHYILLTVCVIVIFVICYRHVLHKYANEDVSLGSWFIGLDVQHIDDRRLCCGTPPGNHLSWLILYILHYPLKSEIALVVKSWATYLFPLSILNHRRTVNHNTTKSLK